MTEMQLTLDGGEVTIPASMATWHPTAHQAVALRLARRPEGVTTLQLGTALHTLRKSLGRGSCGAGAKSYGVKPRSKGCCLYASSDGYAVLKRLWERGVVEQRTYRGPYFAVVND